ncbi:hypothetical protein DM01DRAFT_1104738 [Hesseltinella vesiculosa]|uniref:Uncharacterized protein n=1 Tax=Hesseltinella vesiculosa TaxID=101127 RepID=A0A1X2GAV5_9FUNG|nr:hypothetical protein DM01DRAFT_1104738 [Hesseltinella vesiculosa]
MHRPSPAYPSLFITILHSTSPNTDHHNTTTHNLITNNLATSNPTTNIITTSNTSNLVTLSSSLHNLVRQCLQPIHQPLPLFPLTMPSHPMPLMRPTILLVHTNPLTLSKTSLTSLPLCLSTHATTSVKQPLPPSSPIGATSPAPASVTTRAQRRRSKSLSSLNPPLPLLTTNIHHNIPAATSPSPKDASPVNLSAILSHSTSAQDLSPRPDQHTSSPRQTRPIPSFYSQQELRQVQSSTDLADYARVANGSASTDSLGKKQNFMQRMASLATRRKKTFKMNTLPPISA